MSENDIKITTLDNGLRVVTDYRPRSGIVDFSIMNGIGSRFENKAENGIVHAVEHCGFRGTEKFPGKQILYRIENGGGMSNAMTSYEYMSCDGTALAQTALEQFDILGDIAANANFPSEEVTTELKSILQEKLTSLDEIDDVVDDGIQFAAYGDHPLGRSVLGTIETIGAMSADSLREFVDTHYAFDKIVVSAVGNVNHDSLVEAAHKKFDKKNWAKHAATTQPAAYQGGQYHVEWDMEQIALALAFESVRQDDPDYYAAEALSLLLGNCQTSRLFNDVRQKRGLAYDVRTETTHYADTGLFTVHCTSEKKTTKKEVIPIICDQIVQTQNGFTDEEIARTKNQLLVRGFSRNQDMTDRAQEMAADILLLDRIDDVQQDMAEIAALDNEKIIAVAKRIFTSKPTYVALGPTKGLPSYKNLCERLKF